PPAPVSGPTPASAAPTADAGVGPLTGAGGVAARDGSASGAMAVRSCAGGVGAAAESLAGAGGGTFAEVESPTVGKTSADGRAGSLIGTADESLAGSGSSVGVGGGSIAA